MGLNEVQRALAQLYTSKELREKFLSDPQEIASLFGLNSIDIEHLTALSVSQLQEFANSLQYKRLGEVRKTLSLTEKSLKSKFRELFLEFTNKYLPSGVKKHRDDAIAFVKFIASPINKDIPDWVKELARYEVTHLELIETSKLLKIKIFSYPLKQIVHSLLQDKEVVARKKLTLAIWIKLSKQKGWHHYLLTLPSS